MKKGKNDADILTAKEAELRNRYGERVLPDSIRREPDGKHITVLIACEEPGCKETRRVATSDLFQVSRCPECTKTARAETRKAKAQAKKAPAKKTRKGARK